MKKTIELSVIADAIEMATSEWHQFYHVGSGEVRSLRHEEAVRRAEREYEELKAERDRMLAAREKKAE